MSSLKLDRSSGASHCARARALYLRQQQPAPGGGGCTAVGCGHARAGAGRSLGARTHACGTRRRAPLGQPHRPLMGSHPRPRPTDAQRHTHVFTEQHSSCPAPTPAPTQHTHGRARGARTPRSPRRHAPAAHSRRGSAVAGEAGRVVGVARGALRQVPRRGHARLRAGAGRGTWVLGAPCPGAVRGLCATRGGGGVGHTQTPPPHRQAGGGRPLQHT